MRSPRYRILPLLMASGLPRVASRTTTAMIRMTMIAIAMFKGVNNPGDCGVAAVVVLRIIRLLLDGGGEIHDRLVPLRQTDFSKPAQGKSHRLFRLELGCFSRVGQCSIELVLHNFRPRFLGPGNVVLGVDFDRF